MGNAGKKHRRHTSMCTLGEEGRICWSYHIGHDILLIMVVFISLSGYEKIQVLEYNETE